MTRTPTAAGVSCRSCCAAFDPEPLSADFPLARRLIVVRPERTINQTGQTTTESRYYLSSREPANHTPAQWLGLIRGPWGGVEVRNHWRRDAVMGENGSRSRNPDLLANRVLIRSALVRVLARAREEPTLPQWREPLRSNPARCLARLAQS